MPKKILPVINKYCFRLPDEFVHGINQKFRVLQFRSRASFTQKLGYLMMVDDNHEYCIGMSDESFVPVEFRVQDVCGDFYWTTGYCLFTYQNPFLEETYAYKCDFPKQEATPFGEQKAHAYLKENGKYDLIVFSRSYQKIEEALPFIIVIDKDKDGDIVIERDPKVFGADMTFKKYLKT
ncbi:hypothetical protein TVAG_167640 [Trichomonas vaginalis G3]|uniref:Uncharacterized protein n=1 Tax=Trichomonas vaginalis (strain ATCC PRA-98 / G3) TaxID=412133 RepID=A2G2J3_TRIV3|nr:hypothetical protein TVAGG3_0918830 [Trichomonas vaginalis G3]EAX88617.1 hypothetical protein TVAG_167640 [Trichomonas vaginalis G3]KAI5485001.1 hypothetical protein TVAGG3_0918830 [Trichomonas vaginalis G3]|eukprot:XP_001301547.1 hypothetical protein [Trichomonas vaginalis G3]